MVRPRVSAGCRVSGRCPTGGELVVAVAGDGYFEIFKHVWLASYLLALSGLCLAGAATTALAGRLRDR